MAKKSDGFVTLKVIFLLALFTALTWYAIFYMGREDKIIGALSGKARDAMPSGAADKPSGAAVVPPGTELMPAALAVKGDKKFVQAVTDALEIIWDADKDTYGFIRDNLTEIRNDDSTGFYRDASGWIASVSNANAFYTKTWLAGIIAHQAYHSWNRRKTGGGNGRQPSPPRPGEKQSRVYELNPLKGKVTTLDDVFAAEEQAALFQIQVLRLVKAPAAEINLVVDRKPRDLSYAHDGNFTITQ